MTTINISSLFTRYINLPEYKNRSQSMINLLEFHGITNYERVDGISNDIEKAHRNAVSCKGPLLVLEDDCVPIHYLPTIDVPDDADLLFLGACPYNFLGNRISENLWKIDYMISTTAVVYLTDKAKNIILNQPLSPYKPIDEYLATKLCEIVAYGVNAPFWYQYDVPEVTATALSNSPTKPPYHGGGYPDYPMPLTFK